MLDWNKDLICLLKKDLDAVASGLPRVLHDDPREFQHVRSDDFGKYSKPDPLRQGTAYAVDLALLLLVREHVFCAVEDRQVDRTQMQFIVDVELVDVVGRTHHDMRAFVPKRRGSVAKAWHNLHLRAHADTQS